MHHKCWACHAQDGVCFACCKTDLFWQDLLARHCMLCEPLSKKQPRGQIGGSSVIIFLQTIINECGLWLTACTHGLGKGCVCAQWCTADVCTLRCKHVLWLMLDCSICMRCKTKGKVYVKKSQSYLPECLDSCDKQVIQPRSSGNPTAHMPKSYCKSE